LPVEIIKLAWVCGYPDTEHAADRGVFRDVPELRL
jgi:hypothetical protein